MSDLFTYPLAPGFKRPGTSEEAAESVRDVEFIRGRAYARIKALPRTADEVARSLGLSVLSVRPRVTELFNLGLIEDSGHRRKNASGRRAIVWRVKRA